MAFFQGMSLQGAEDGAGPAADTFIPIVGKLRPPVLGFGVMAPHTIQGAAFEEHRCADTRPVMERKTLYVKNNPRNRV
jgi:hypothetical protein